MRVWIKDEETRNEPYFIYVERHSWHNFTGLRFDNRRKAEQVVRCIERAYA